MNVRTKIKYQGDWYKFVDRKGNKLIIRDRDGVTISIDDNVIEDVKEPMSLSLIIYLVAMVFVILVSVFMYLKLSSNNDKIEVTTTEASVNETPSKKSDSKKDYINHDFTYTITYTDGSVDVIENHVLIAPVGMRVDLEIQIVDGVPCLCIMTDNERYKILNTNVKRCDVTTN